MMLVMTIMMMTTTKTLPFHFSEMSKEIRSFKYILIKLAKGCAIEDSFLLQAMLRIGSFCTKYRKYTIFKENNRKCAMKCPDLFLSIEIVEIWVFSNFFLNEHIKMNFFILKAYKKVFFIF